MRTIILLIGAVIITALATAGVMSHQYRAEIRKAQVTSFNDGFETGACRNGEDGFGNICR